MATPAVTQEYTPGSHRNSRKTMKLPRRWEMKPDSPALPVDVGMWEEPCLFCLKWNGPREALTQKKARFPWSGLNSGLSFISQDESMSESPVETLETAVGVRLIWTGGLTSLWPLERHTEFNAS